MTTFEKVSFSFLLYQFNTVGIASSLLRDFYLSVDIPGDNTSIQDVIENEFTVGAVDLR